MILRIYRNYLGILGIANIFYNSFRNREHRLVKIRRDLKLFKAKVKEGVTIN